MSGTDPRSKEEERFRMIAEAAYFRAAQRGFKAGSDLDDWIAAEAEIDRMLLESEHALERQALLKKIEKQLENWDKKVIALKTLSGEAGTEIRKELDLLAVKRAELEAKAHDIAHRSSEVWENLKTSTEAARNEMRKIITRISKRFDKE